ncbi:MAG: c-type cytochrome [Pseudomonadota bacterium]
MQRGVHGKKHDTVAFSSAIAALIGGKPDAARAHWSRPWTLIARVFLTTHLTGWSYIDAIIMNRTAAVFHKAVLLEIVKRAYTQAAILFNGRLWKNTMTAGINNIKTMLVSGILVLIGAATNAFAEVPQGNKGNPDGAYVFLTFCAGCHGVDGFAAYPAAPSFSMGDRLFKDDSTLLQSVMSGKGAMPPWEDKLPVPMLRNAIQYLRVMNERAGVGLAPRQQNLPAYMYRFQPTGERNRYWWHMETE